MKASELLEFDRFPSLCFAIGLGLAYYYAYWGSRLILLQVLTFLTSILPFGFFLNPNIGAERLLVVFQ